MGSLTGKREDERKTTPSNAWETMWEDSAGEEGDDIKHPEFSSVEDGIEEKNEAERAQEELLAQAQRRRVHEEQEILRWKRKLKEEERLEELWECGEELPQEKQQQEESEPPFLLIASDLHYISRDMHDHGAAFQRMIANDDGKISQYSDVIVDALLDEVLEQKPSAFVLAGDNTLNGERENHRKLAQKLHVLQQAGVQVLIIPGNHDIQNDHAGTYFGEQKALAEYLHSGQEFFDIFHEFGYDQALSRDPASLSYLYVLDDTHWIIMLDSCIYEDSMHVDGRIREDTIHWMEELLQEAEKEDICVVVFGHHNLLSESRLYKTQCILLNNQDVIELLEKYYVPLYISGHLHAQRIKRHKSEPGIPDEAYEISEIVMSPFSIPPCQYGSLAWSKEDHMLFQTLRVDIPRWIHQRMDKKKPLTKEEREILSGDFIWANDENLTDLEVLSYLTEEDIDFLKNFPVKSEEYVKNIVRSQVDSTIWTLPIPRFMIDEMENLYTELYYRYCAGYPIDWNEVQKRRAYRYWKDFDKGSSYIGKSKEIALDMRKGMSDLELSRHKETISHLEP